MNFLLFFTLFSPAWINDPRYVLIRSNEMQQYAGFYLLQNYSVHVSGVYRTHHQEYIKL